MSTSIKSLCIVYSSLYNTSNLRDLILYCHSLIHVAIFEQPRRPIISLDMLGLITTLRSLAGDFSSFFPSPEPSLHHPLFAQLTHIAVADVCGTWSRWDWDSLAPTIPLTHIALSYHPFVSSADPKTLWSEDPAAVGILRKILKRFQNLRVCVLAVEHVAVWQTPRTYRDRLDDPSVAMYGHGDWRLVGLACENLFVDWNPEYGRRRDFWARAEEKVARNERRGRRSERASRARGERTMMAANISRRDEHHQAYR